VAASFQLADAFGKLKTCRHGLSASPPPGVAGLECRPLAQRGSAAWASGKK
jgi:hypothetical protein